MTVQARDLNGWRVPAFRPGSTQSAAFTSSSAAISNAVGANTRVVRLVATTDCFVAFGSAPTATTSGLFLPAGVPEYFRVDSGDKVAAIRSTSDGTLYVTEMA